MVRELRPDVEREINVERLALALHIWFVPLPDHSHCERDHGAADLAAEYERLGPGGYLLQGDGADPGLKTNVPGFAATSLLAQGETTNG